MALALLSAIIGGIAGAILGAYLQQRWTPDYSPRFTELREQLAAFQQRIETLEQERAESEQFTLELRLQQAVPGNYTMTVQNDSDEEVTVETVNLMYGDAKLSRASKPRATDDWKVGPHSGKQIWWAPQPDPVVTLQYLDPNIGRGTLILIWLVLTYRFRGKSRALSTHPASDG